MILLSLTPIFWFVRRPGVLIDGVDTNFPLDPSVWFRRRLFVWSSVANAGQNFSASVAGTFFHFIQYLPFKLGFSLQNVEIISLLFWFSLIIFSSWFLARNLFPRKSIPQIVFVILYSLNIWLFNSWENVKVANLGLASAIPLGISIFILLRDKKIKRGLASILSIVTGIVLAGAGINPAYIICFFLILTIVFIGEIFVKFGNWKFILERFKDFLLISIFITLVNAFWILPSLVFILGNIASSNSIGAIGFANWVDSLSEHTSFVNVLRMQGAWDWYTTDSATKLPLYIPYAVNYFYNPIFIGFSFLVPFLAFLAFLFSKKKYLVLYVSFGIMLTLGIFLTAGTHTPSGDLFSFFARHIPFFSLFRSPWYIFAPLVGLSIAGLVSIFFDTINEVFPARFVTVFGAIFIAGSLLYSYPILLGKIYRPSSSQGFFIKFPSYVYDVKNYLANTRTLGRILSYPDDNIEKFNWGYSGTDSILNLFSDKETIFTPLNDTDSPLSKIISNIYLSIKKENLTEAINLARSLSITTIFDKRDQNSLAPVLQKNITNNKLASFGSWTFYNLLGINDGTKIKTSSCCELSYPYSDSSLNLALTDTNQILINPQDSLFSNSNLFDKSGFIIHATNSQLNDLKLPDLKSRLSIKDLSTVRYSIDVSVGGDYSPIIEKRGIDSFGLLNNNKINVTVDGKNQIWNIISSDDTYLYFQSITIKAGKHDIAFGLTSKNLVNELNYIKKGNANFDYTGGIFTLLNSAQNNASFDFPVSTFDPYSTYLVSFNYIQLFGNDAEVITQQNRDSALYVNQTQSLPTYPFWQSYSYYYSPVQTESSLDIELTEPGNNDAFGSKTQFKTPSVYKVFDNNLFFKMQPNSMLNLGSITYKENSPVSYSGKVTAGSGPQVILFNENYSPDWQLIVNGSTTVKIYHFSGNYYANAWYIDGAPGNFDFTIFYKPQKFLNYGYIIASISIIAATVYFIYDQMNKRNGK